MPDYAAVILAAGHGKRMGALGEQYPKALLPVGDEPLIGHQLRMFAKLRIHEVYVIIGHLGAHLAEVIGTGATYGVDIRYIEQGPALGSAFALARAIPYLHKPFLVTLGDYYFEAVEAGALTRCLDRGVSAISGKREPNAQLLREACELYVAADGKLERIVEKPCSPRGNVKGCGFYAFQPMFLDSLSRTPRTALRDEYELSVALDVHLSAGQPIYVEEIIGLDWNFTRARDVLDCNLCWLRRRQERAYVAKSAEIDERASLDEVIVGSRAHLRGTMTLRRVVVFPEAVVAGDTVLESALVTPGALLHV
jgi:NDP-sugar pyrophosphorylase family protein